ncbi:MAG: hypothetical protein A3F70_10575 [Acidobacteria bacterium RIFCSPLOWO2_12_FULL_67_14]|nr:MAG: hypothetical protein A3H29_09500 [Acidobacteria bacterium RIFCSPLOWO2_02_FULL_67_21]OFW35176.1 MAG: hypothetical protein A3F70_10575 [Acidobacteria bacterium RIFCSPLOWO2_12_FULL_67_14]
MGPLEIYFIDTEGGQSVLLVSPAIGMYGTRETFLIDPGNLNPPGRDAERIIAALKDAGVPERIDHMIVSHYHGDHVGGAAALADKVTIRRVYDPGAVTPELNGNRESGFMAYLPVRNILPVSVPKAGQKIPVAGLDVTVVSVAGELLKTPLNGVRRSANSQCNNPMRQIQDNTPNNAESIGVVVEFGKFRYLDLADLTWNQEIELVCPNNLLGQVQLYRTTRHGAQWSGSPALVHSVQPRVAVMNNNPTKGGVALTFKTVKSSPGLEDLWQLHWSENPGAQNSAENMVANFTKDDPGHFIRVTARNDGSMTVKNGRNGFTKEYSASRAPVVTSSR